MPVMTATKADLTRTGSRTWRLRCIALSIAIGLWGTLSRQVCWGQPEPTWREIQAKIPPKLVVNEQRVAAAGLERFSGKHLTVYTDVRGRADIADLANAFDAAVPQLANYFRVNPAALEGWHLTASVMLDRQRFVEAGLYPDDLPDFLAGYQRDNQIWVLPQNGAYYTRHLVLHEGVHAFMTHFFGGVGPAWYCEGIAELAALHRWEASRMQLPYDPRARDEVPYWGRVRLLRDELRAGRFRSLPDVFAIQPAEFRQVEAYAWAWAACKFLHEHPRTREVFAALPDHLRRPPSEVQAWFDDQLRTAVSRAEADGTDAPSALPESRPRDSNADEAFAGGSAGLSIEWTVFITEIDYGYDVAAMAWRDAIKATDGSEAIEIDSRYGWQRSPWQVAAGEQITLAATGEFQVGDDGQPWLAQPNGVTLEYHRGVPLGCLSAWILPVDVDQTAASAPPIEIGIGTTFPAPRDGVLWFRLNDSPAKLADNRGTVRIERIRKAK